MFHAPASRRGPHRRRDTGSAEGTALSLLVGGRDRGDPLPDRPHRQTVINILIRVPQPPPQRSGCGCLWWFIVIILLLLLL